ncbi:putative mitochondrial hypothetical protein [Leptomonas pyrrhocoris]|uniref:Uncharacterized protein n=1 Tax=Leptomonas pyrrhocoris TaxID=157538 RepID=A0A0N0VI27_LEPPY|nr:putative mitochondrial hypothetical protein [Leptomonas pyrrhocoris]XP_015664882.1 putative mitochondrial hypothetical protein [Leptomonas pyrrhocoris]XP_015664883.1 putative mitochondrial hypothetical protein [Leptomonas pyrrhocoris]XP_015664884.1 putative mitochondrial hypothetical protein [Leptomonas pyrrhocoris]KPA86442.1 putative mitochondrial hypothetical protein [Leptomonas pyrrhocoris]KPA86443.1 putative mitochondrial hypothetical protein [Leptomonas pyrrhocoris]KPA86444.1 putative|eukprot:XP_015664881.1 putative mitochondrial hypothetical protein [Leptomonas pyrrhocoris]
MELSTTDPAAQLELQRMTQAIEKYAARLDTVGTELKTIEEQNLNDNVSRQIQQYTEVSQSKADIAAEDALDNIVRLQNQLKIVRRRNELLARENTMQEKLVRDRAKTLQTTSTELQNVMAATGWYDGKREVQFSQMERERADIHDMAFVEASLQADIKNARVANAKLEKTILALNAKIQDNEERRTKYMQLRNSIRVREKECNELRAKTQRIAADNHQLQLVVQSGAGESVAEISTACMESDREFLADAVQDMKVACRRQENVIKAQIARQQQLQTRLDTVMKSLREMRLAREFERNVAKSALVPSASREEPQDVAEVLPEDEYIPVDTYRLLYKNNEMMRTNVARKNMLVLEKESAVQSMEAKVASNIENHNEIARHDDEVQMYGTEAVRATQQQLDAEASTLSQQVDKLRASNTELRARIAKKTKMTPARRSTAAHQKK